MTTSPIAQSAEPPRLREISFMVFSPVVAPTPRNLTALLEEPRQQVRAFCDLSVPVGRTGSRAGRAPLGARRDHKQPLMQLLQPMMMGLGGRRSGGP